MAAAMVAEAMVVVVRVVEMVAAVKGVGWEVAGICTRMGRTESIVLQ